MVSDALQWLSCVTKAFSHLMYFLLFVSKVNFKLYEFCGCKRKFVAVAKRKFNFL